MNAVGQVLARDLALTDTLRELGYGYTSAVRFYRNRPLHTVGRKAIVRDGRIVATLDAGETWDWLHRLDRKVAALRGAP